MALQKYSNKTNMQKIIFLKSSPKKVGSFKTGFENLNEMITNTSQVLNVLFRNGCLIAKREIFS